MDPNPTQVTQDFQPFFEVHSTGHVERFYEHDYVPPSLDPKTSVISKDVIISPENQVSARIYLPNTAKPDKKQPLIIYIHGGGFTTQSAFSSFYHNYVNALSSITGCIVVSVDYRLAPENLVYACYDDSWDVINWFESHSQVGEGSGPWLNEYVDFNQVYLAGDSAGANIAHNMSIRADSKDYKIAGLVLIHPFFGISGESNELWDYISQDTTGSSDFVLNPGANMDLLSSMSTARVLVCVGEKDLLREHGWNYYQTLKESNWKGEVEFFESPGKNHVFHLLDPGCKDAVSLMERLVGFVRNEAASPQSPI